MYLDTSPNLGFPYFNLLGEGPVKKHPVKIYKKIDCKTIFEKWDVLSGAQIKAE